MNDQEVGAMPLGFGPGAFNSAMLGLEIEKKEKLAPKVYSLQLTPIE